MRSLITLQKNSSTISTTLMMKNICLVLMFIIFSSAFGLAEKSVESQIAEIEKGLLPVNIFEGESSYQLEDRMKFYKVPGLSVTVIKDFKIQWTKTYGVANFTLQNPVTGKTLFRPGSLSKGVSSLTALSLIQKGMFKLDDDANKLLTSWKIPENKFTKNTVVTPALLMNHSSGAMHNYGGDYSRDKFPTITQVLNGAPPASHKPTIIDHEPGTRFLYSNPGYAILQQIIEDVTKKPLYVVGKKNIFDKLGMKQTTFENPLPLELENNTSAGHRGYSVLPGKRRYMANIAAGGLWTTSDDYAKFVIELQKSWHGKSNKVISQDLTREMLSPHVSKEYGFGVFMRNIGKEKYFGHLGDNSGFIAGFISHISEGYGAVIMANSRNSAELIREINKSIAKYYDWAAFVPETIKPVDIDKSTKEEVCGRYRSGSDNFINIIEKDGDLILTNLENSKMFHIGNNTFKIKRRAGEIQFVKDSKTGLLEASYHFADELGRLNSEKKEAVKMVAGEKVPQEILLDGDCEEAARLYKEIFKQDPKDNAVSEMRLNILGYQFMGQSKLKQALCIFKLNTIFYPDSTNVYDSYGEALAKNGEKEEAIRQYEKALKLNPNFPSAIQMLKKLKE